jgi:tetratricopeptide (TPR) repeat protein
VGPDRDTVPTFATTPALQSPSVRRLAPLLFLLVPLSAHATSRATRTVTIPDLGAEEKALFDDVRDDKLDHYDPVTAALVGSTASSRKRTDGATRWGQFLDQMKHELAGKDAKTQAQQLLTKLHQLLLTGGYDFSQNDMAVLLTEGRFNCVTSAIAYQAAGQALGLDVAGVIVPSHVYVRVVVGRVSYDVETTSPSGFLLDKDDGAYAAFLAKMKLDSERKTGRKFPSEKFSRSDVDAIGMVALAYANRGALAVEAGDDPAAIGLFARTSLLAQDERYARDSRDLLLEQAAERRIADDDLDGARALLRFAVKDPGGDPTIVAGLKENIGYAWAIEADQRLQADDYQAAIDDYAEGQKWSNDPALPHNQKAAWSVWGLKELSDKRFDKSAALFERAHKLYPDEKEFTQNIKATYFQWTQAELADKDCDGAMTAARALRADLPGDPDADAVFASTASSCADVLAAGGDWPAATALLEQAIKEAPRAGLSRKAAAAWTNAGVGYVKSGDEDKAAHAWKRALELDPTDVAARTNLDQLRHR